jgi:hypothetical protein
MRYTIAICAFLVLFALASDAHRVSIPGVGNVIGHAHSEDASIVSFLGVRYAKSPEGDLRWAAPQPATWTEKSDFDAREGVACAQGKSVIVNPDLEITEDCLRINIWVKNTTLTAATAPGAKLYVGVWPQPFWRWCFGLQYLAFCFPAYILAFSN